MIVFQGPRDILVLWRFEYARAKYTWLPHAWNSDDAAKIQNSYASLRENVYLLQRGTLRMDATAVPGQLVCIGITN